MTETPHPWDRLPTETPKAYAAFLAYCAMGAKRSVREAARNHHSETVAKGYRKSTASEATIVSRWLAWSAKHNWVKRGFARAEWIERVSDEAIIENVKACKLALTIRAQDFLDSNDSEEFLRGARAFTLQHPPVQLVADVSERFEDLSYMSDEGLKKMKKIRDAERKEKAKTDDRNER